MLKEVLYKDLKKGDIFTYNEPFVKTLTGTIKGDKRIYRKDREGATQIVDVYGDKIVNPTFKEYPYLTMTVYKVEG